MSDRVSIQTGDFDLSAEVARLRAGEKGVGAVCTFVGTVRDRNDGQSVSTMELEHYPGMTEKAIEQMIDEAHRRFDIFGARVIHRVGLLQPLDDQYAALGWDKVLNDSAIQLGRYDENGIFGSGPIYGIPTYGEFVSVFYNADMLAAEGLSVPTTMDEFEAVMDKFVAKGITPIAEAANDYPAQHLMYLLALSKADAAWVANFEGLKGPLDSAPFLYAGQKIYSRSHSAVSAIA